MSEQQEQQVQVAQVERKTDDRWGDDSSEGRQAELQRYLDRWEVETDHGGRKGPFDSKGAPGVQLTGADVDWLAKRVQSDGFLHSVSDLHLEGANLFQARLERAGLHEAHLRGPSFSIPTWKGPTSSTSTSKERTSCRLT